MLSELGLIYTGKVLHIYILPSLLPLLYLVFKTQRRILFSFAIYERQEDPKDAKQTVYSVLLYRRYAFRRPVSSLPDAELRKTLAS
jgi:hypothetical protein